MSVIKELNEEMLSCQKCPLYKNGKVVIGRGTKTTKPPVDVLFVGEAPGTEESKEGKPFVGRSGKLLDNWIKVFRTENYAVVNVVKHMPLDENRKIRKPSDEEVSLCSPYLFRQIETIKPKAIIALGDTAMRALCNVEAGKTIGNLILSSLPYKNNKNISVFIYWHPAYVLRNLASVNWQEEISELAKKVTGSALVEASKLWSTSGVKAATQEKELKSVEVKDHELEYPLIGLRTEYSFMEFGGKLDDEIKYIKSHSGSVIAVADDNTTSSFMKLRLMKDFGIKTIYGEKIKLGKLSFSLFVKSLEGYKNLNKISTRVKIDMDLEYDSLISYLALNNKDLVLVIPSEDFEQKNEELYNKIISLFRERYIGKCYSSLTAKIRANYLAEKHPEMKTIVYQNNKYSGKDDYNTYILIKAIKTHQKFKDLKTLDKNTKSYIVEIGEINEPDIIENTKEFAQMFDFEIPMYRNLLPEEKVTFPEFIKVSDAEVKRYADENEIDYASAEKRLKFDRLVRKFDLTNYIRKYSERKKISYEEAAGVYEKRLKDEIELITSKNFIDYFLVVYDLVNFVERSGMVISPGRGSVGGSLVARCLGIIRIDPINNYLMFERFINEDRIDLPDIDLDFQSSFREQIIGYLKNKYNGEETRVVPSCDILSFKERSALRDAGKAMDIPLTVLNEINSFLIKRTSGDARSGHVLEQTFETFPNIKAYREQYPEFFDAAAKIEGQKKTYGTHASGIMLLKDDYYNYVSLTRSTNNIVTCFEYPEMEKMGLVKLDVLGLNTLDIVYDTVKKAGIKEINFEDPNLDGSGNTDPKVFRLFKEQRTAGAFQVSTSMMTRLGSALTDTFKDIVALNGIGRPAPIRIGIPEQYRNAKETGHIASLGNKKVDEVLDKYELFHEFYNIPLFQEQIMIIFSEVAGFYAAHSNSAIKAISKSKGIVTFFEQYGKMFVEGAEKKSGLSQEEAEKLFKKIYQFGSYAYNASHATLYGYLIYYTLWLKANHEREFYEACLNMLPKDKLPELHAEMDKTGYKVVHPDINKSEINSYSSEVYNNKFIFYKPLKDIKYITSLKAEEIIKSRPYTDLDELFNKVKISNRVRSSILETYDSDTFSINSLTKGTMPFPTLTANSDKIKEIIKERADIEVKSVRQLVEESNKKVKEQHKEKMADRFGGLFLNNGWIIGISQREPRYASIGDDLPITEVPTKEQIETDRKYSRIKKWGWMSKWCKIAIEDSEGTTGFINVMPDIYNKQFKDIMRIKNTTLLLCRVEVKQTVGDRMRMLEFKIVSDLFKDEIKNEEPKLINGE